MRISTYEIFQRGLEGILKQQKALSDLQLQISQGKRLLKPSDDPVSATRALILRQDKSSIEQFLNNSNHAQSNLEAEEATLKSINTVYQRVRELAVQAANPTLSQTDKKTIVSELHTRLDELVALANSKNPDNEHMFSGSLGRMQTIVRKGNEYLYQGDEGQRFTQIGDSLQVGISDTGKDIFFNVPSNQVRAQGTLGWANAVMPASGLVASGSLTNLNLNDLILNRVDVAPSVIDGVSSTDANASSLALANAINTSFGDHGVRAHALPNQVNMGVLTPGVFAAGDLTLNGIMVIDPTGTESSLLNTLQSLEAQTGVIASQPGGPGTDIVLTAQDGRNIQLQTDGASAANFGNFDLNSGVQDSVQRGALEFRSPQGFTIGGANPNVVGLTAGSLSVTPNIGTGTLSGPTILSPIQNVDESYSIIFNAGGTTFDIVANSNPLNPLEGFDDVTYVPGQPIVFEGVQVSINGSPNAGDVFGVSFEQPVYQNVFTTIENMIQSLNTTSNIDQLNYEMGMVLDNLNFAETRTLEVRAKVGARLNVIENQKDVHETLKILNADNLSQTEDLDLAKAISDLTQRTTALEAAQASYMKIQSLSLFNFLR